MTPYITAIMPDSVAVQIPAMMEPTIITGITRANREFLNADHTTFQPANFPFGICLIWAYTEAYTI